MRPDLVAGGQFPDLELPEHTGAPVRLSKLAQGFPLIVSFYRGYWWPKCSCQVRHLTALEPELKVNYCHVAVVSTDPPEVSAAFRAGLGASVITFLSDPERRAISELDIVEVTAPGFKHGRVAVPYTFSLAPDLTIHRVYNGWWYVGRPTLEELRHDFRALLQASRDDYEYRPPTSA